ncbi:MAG: peptide deformylase [Candidatus Kerfeldbacteria bacterium]|nr:peptide deformylase [Candidatus Kerfeldbacteria bacterium]
MIIYQAAQIGDPVIRKKSAVVKSVKTQQAQKIIHDLIDSMRHHHLVGMAAPQIGKNVRIFVTEIRKTKFRKHLKTLDPLRVFVNPKIIRRSRSVGLGMEGCGSVASAQIFGSVPRPKEVQIEALDEYGHTFVLSVRGLLARVVQHELDHLDGLIFLDRMKTMKSLISLHSRKNSLLGSN